MNKLKVFRNVCGFTQIVGMIDMMLIGILIEFYRVIPADHLTVFTLMFIFMGISGVAPVTRYFTRNKQDFNLIDPIAAVSGVGILIGSIALYSFYF